MAWIASQHKHLKKHIIFSGENRIGAQPLHCVALLINPCSPACLFYHDSISRLKGKRIRRQRPTDFGKSTFGDMFRRPTLSPCLFAPSPCYSRQTSFASTPSRRKLASGVTLFDMEAASSPMDLVSARTRDLMARTDFLALPNVATW